MRTVTHKGITWIDCPHAVEKELLSLQKKYGFHELDIEDCLSEHERPKVEEYDDYMFLVFHIPFLRPESGRISKEEINIFVGQDFFVTVHEGRIPLMGEIWLKLKNSEKSRGEFMEYGTGFLLYELMNKLFEGLFPIVDSITKAIRSMEEKLFEAEEQVDILRDIMTLKRNIITMRSVLLPQRTLIGTLEHKNRKFVSEELSLYFDNILDAIERQWSLLDTAKEMIDSLQNTHESWLTHKTNTIVRILTVFSVTMLPLTVLTGLFGMNVLLPYQENPQAFTGLMIGMAVLVSLMLGYFARKGWI